MTTKTVASTKAPTQDAIVGSRIPTDGLKAALADCKIPDEIEVFQADFNLGGIVMYKAG